MLVYLASWEQESIASLVPELDGECCRPVAVVGFCSVVAVEPGKGGRGECCELPSYLTYQSPAIPHA